MDKAAVESNGTAGMPIKCRAAVARKAEEALVIEEVIVEAPKSGEVRIRIICTSLCHSDITFWKLKDACFPVILGHEALGVVESVGDDVVGLDEGDTVVPTFLSDCGECRDCTSKRSNLCSKFPMTGSPWMYDGSSRFRSLKGETLHHFFSVSSFTEYTVMHAVNVTKIDPIVPPSRACLLSCGVSTGVGAAWRSADVEAGSTVAIFGLGSVGLAVAEGARLRGAAKIIGVDVNPEKCEISKAFGVTDFIDSTTCGKKTISQIINEMTDGGADYCFECVGKASLVEEAYSCCRKSYSRLPHNFDTKKICHVRDNRMDVHLSQGWGKTIMVGAPDQFGAQLMLSCFEVLFQGKTLLGSSFGGLKPKSDIPILIKSYMDKELELDKFITHEVGFEDINKAFDLLIAGKSLRCVIWMEK